MSANISSRLLVGSRWKMRSWHSTPPVSTQANRFPARDVSCPTVVCTRPPALIHIRVWNWPQALEAQWGLFVPGEMQRATHTSADLGVLVDNKISRLVSSCDSTSVLCRYLIRAFRITMIRRVYLFGLLISLVSSAGGLLPFSLLLHFVPPICQVLFFSAAFVSQWLRALARVS